MNKPSNPVTTLAEYKIQASLLLKSIRSTDPNHVQQALKRFKRLPDFINLSPEEISTATIKRKHALAIIAKEKGFDSWAALKMQVNFIIGGFLNPWFSDYDEAKAYRQARGGFLLPYKNQFFICTASYITAIGFNAQDPDWQLIGWDWVKPQNSQAKERLYKKWSHSQERK